MNYSTVFKGLGSLLLFFLLATTSTVAKDYRLLIREAIPHRAGNLPVHVFLSHDGSQFTKGVAHSFYWPMSADMFGGNGRNGNLKNYQVDYSGLSRNGNEISGTLKVTLEPGKDHEQTITTSIQISETASGQIKGSHEGTANSQSIRGNVTGQTFSDFDPAAAKAASVFLKYPIPPDFDEKISKRSLVVNLFFDNGSVQNAEANYAFFEGSVTSSNKPQHIVTSFVSANGTQGSGMRSPSSYEQMNVQGRNLTLSGDSLKGSVDIQIFEDGNDLGTYTYQLSTAVLAERIIGHYEVFDSNDEQVASNKRLAGQFGDTTTLSIPSFAEVDTLPSPGGSGFQPPYFEDLSQKDFRKKLEAAARFMYNRPEVAAFHSEASCVGLNGSGEKQYDGKSENAYAPVMAMSMLHELSQDQQIKQKALETAERGGYINHAHGYDMFNYNFFYKSLYHTAVWQGRSYLELYLKTGDPEWLEKSRYFASTLEKTQAAVEDSVNGTWTYYWDGFDPQWGKTLSRNNRQFDWIPFNCAEYLYFLGRLRKEAGVTEFRDVERKAQEWMANNINWPNMWLDRRGHWDLNEEESGYAPTTYLAYLLNYADNPPDSLIDKMVQYAEDSLIDWRHPTSDSDFKPSLKYFFPRNLSKDVGVSTAARMGWNYLKIFQMRGDSVYLKKGKALVYSALRMQNSSGLIHNGGLQFSANHQDRLNQTKGHEYANLDAELLHSLYRSYKILTQLQEFPGDNLMAQVSADTSTGVAPLTVNFDATNSQGSNLTYSWDFGDGQTASGPNPSHTFSEKGSYAVELTIENSNGTHDTKQMTVLVTDSLRPATVKVREVNGDPNEANSGFFKNQTHQFKALVLDQYGRKIEPQPPIMWSVDGGNTITSSGMLTTASTPGDSRLFTITAKAPFKGDTGVGTAHFNVFEIPDSTMTGFSISLSGDDSMIERDRFVAGTNRQAHWSHELHPGWGGTRDKMEETFQDQSGRTINQTIIKGNLDEEMHTSGTPNSDYSLMREGLTFSRGEITDIPPIYQGKGYDLYIYAHHDKQEAFPITVSGEKLDTTLWLKGNSSSYDGSYSRATATSESQAQSGSYTNYIKVSGLELDSFAFESPDVAVAGLQILMPDTGGVVSFFEADTTVGPVALEVTFDGSSSIGQNLDYSWDFDDGGTAQGVQATHTFDTPGRYNVELTVTDGNTTNDQTMQIWVKDSLQLDSISLQPDSLHRAISREGQFSVAAFDQFGDPLPESPEYTWEVTGANSISSEGKVTAAEEGNHQVIVSATFKDTTLKDTAKLEVEKPTTEYIGMSVNFQAKDNQKLAPNEIAGIIRLNNWTNMTIPGWGSHTRTFSFPDNRGDSTGTEAKVSDVGTNNTFENWANSNQKMVAQYLKDAGDSSFVIKHIPELYQTQGYDVYIYAYPGGMSELGVNDSTKWVDDKGDQWFSQWVGLMKSEATTKAEAKADTNSNYVVFRGLEAETLNVHGKVAGIQIVTENTGQKAQSISFADIDDQCTSDSSVQLTVSATSGLAVELEVIDGPATLSGKTVEFTSQDSGKVTLRATQAGNSEYLPADTVTQTFTYDKCLGFAKQANKVTKLQLAPNPTSGKVYFLSDSPGLLQQNRVEVYNVDGRRIRTKQNVRSLDFSNEPAGTYLILFRKGEQIKRFKLLKE